MFSKAQTKITKVFSARRYTPSCTFAGDLMAFKNKLFTYDNIVKLLIVISCFFNVKSQAQIAALDCTAAISVCTNPNFSVVPSGAGTIDFNTSNPISNPTNNPAGIVPTGGAGCMKAGELNPAWMIITIQTTGTLEFSMGAGSGVQNGCYDWIMWNLFPNTCNDIKGNAQAPVRCCWNSFCVGGTGLASPSNLPLGGYQQDYGAPLNVNCGDKFVLCFSNYSSVTTLVPLNFFGTASVSCTTVSCTTSSENFIAPVSSSGNFVLYPNPSTGTFFISSRENEQIIISNESGKEIKRLNLCFQNNFIEQVTEFENGIYFIKGKNTVKKMVVIK